MKVLHTGDWHIGQVFYNYDRSDEHRAFLGHLAGIVRETAPDVMVVCGDIFHTASPSTAAQKLYIEGLVRIHEAAPGMEIVVIAGNHDSGSRIEVDRLLWEEFNVHTVGSVARDTEGMSVHIIPVGNPLKGYVVAVPYCNPLNFPVIEEGSARQERQAEFFRRLLEMVSEVNPEGLPVVLAAHATVIGCNPGRQDITVGGIDSMDMDDIGSGYDYMALGHIHFPQDIGKKARYAGSPLPVSFNEDYRHSVTLVSIGEKGSDVKKETIVIPTMRAVRTIPEDGAVEFEDALKMLEEFPQDEDAYIRLNVKVRQYGGADWAERASRATDGKKCRYCCMLMESSAGAEMNQGRATFSREEFKTKSPVDIAGLYWKEKTGEDMDGELVKLLEKAVAEASEGNRQE
ncbi:MAG: exonuclease SbcCD subunit D [Candidatus Cryptobacteroides sp.]